jgi:hypothetical protein
LFFSEEFALGTLVSIIREDLSFKQMWQRLAGVRAAEILHPQVVKELLDEKFNAAAFASNETCLPRIVWLLAAAPDYQPPCC